MFVPGSCHDKGLTVSWVYVRGAQILYPPRKKERQVGLGTHPVIMVQSEVGKSKQPNVGLWFRELPCSLAVAILLKALELELSLWFGARRTDSDIFLVRVKIRVPREKKTQTRIYTAVAPHLETAEKSENSSFVLPERLTADIGGRVIFQVARSLEGGGSCKSLGRRSVPRNMSSCSLFCLKLTVFHHT